MRQDKREHRIKSVAKGSIAEELNIEPNDILISIDGERLVDVFDYHYMVNTDFLVLLIRKQDGDEWEIETFKFFLQFFKCIGRR